MGAHTPIKEREEIVARFHRSGLTQREFCEAEGVKLSAFRSWLYKRKQARADQQPRFVEVTSTKRATEADAIELRLGEIRIVIPMTIANLLTENRVLREQLGDQRIRFTDAQRRRLAHKCELRGSAELRKLATIATRGDRPAKGRAATEFKPLGSFNAQPSISSSTSRMVSR